MRHALRAAQAPCAGTQCGMRCARRRLRNSRPVLGSGLGKIGQAHDPEIVARAKPNPPRRGQGRPGARGSER